MSRRHVWNRNSTGSPHSVSESAVRRSSLRKVSEYPGFYFCANGSCYRSVISAALALCAYWGAQPGKAFAFGNSSLDLLCKFRIWLDLPQHVDDLPFAVDFSLLQIVNPIGGHNLHHGGVVEAIENGHVFLLLLFRGLASSTGAGALHQRHCAHGIEPVVAGLLIDNHDAFGQLRVQCVFHPRCICFIPSFNVVKSWFLNGRRVLR